MYIRRKVFSVVKDENTGEEKLFSVTERNFSVNKIANFVRKTKRNFKNAGEEFVAGMKAAAGKDLTPKDVKAIARNQSIGLKKGKKAVSAVDGKVIQNESLIKSKEAFRDAARKGQGASVVFGNAFFH